MPTGGHARAGIVRDANYFGPPHPVPAGLHPVALMMRRLRAPFADRTPAQMRTMRQRSTNTIPLQNIDKFAGTHTRVNRTDQILQRANDTDRRTTQNTRF
jgi:hypothetical protein